MISKIFAYIFEFWHRFISPFLPKSCRFEPTCSIYAAQALRRFGFFKGMALAIKRIGRCHPWGGHGWDPIPDSTARGHKA